MEKDSEISKLFFICKFLININENLIKIELKMWKLRFGLPWKIKIPLYSITEQRFSSF